MHGQVFAEEDQVVPLAECERSEVRHSPLTDHLAGDFCGFFKIVRGSGGGFSEEQLFGDSTSHKHRELRF